MNDRSGTLCVGAAHEHIAAIVLEKKVVAGYVLTTVVALFLTFDAVIKVLQLAPAMEGTLALGYPASSVLPIGLMEPPTARIAPVPALTEDETISVALTAAPHSR